MITSSTLLEGISEFVDNLPDDHNFDPALFTGMVDWIRAQPEDLLYDPSMVEEVVNYVLENGQTQSTEEMFSMFEEYMDYNGLPLYPDGLPETWNNFDTAALGG